MLSSQTCAEHMLFKLRLVQDQACPFPSSLLTDHRRLSVSRAQAGANAGMGGLIFTALAAQAAGGAGPPNPQAQPQAAASPAQAEQAQVAAEDAATGGQPEAEGGQ